MTKRNPYAADLASGRYRKRVMKDRSKFDKKKERQKEKKIKYVSDGVR